MSFLRIENYLKDISDATGSLSALGAKEATQQSVLAELENIGVVLGQVELDTSALTLAVGLPSDVAETDYTQSGSLISWQKGIMQVLTNVWNEPENTLRTTVERIATKVSTVNSTTTLLGPNEEFVGEWEYIADHSIISVIVKADVVSAADGLHIEYSSAGVNRLSGDKYTIAAAPNPDDDGKVFTFGSYGAYARVRYKNGGTGQAFFDLQTMLHPAYCKPSSHRISEPITDETDAEMALAVITAKRDSGMYAIVGANNRGSLRVTTDRPSESRNGTQIDAMVEYQTTNQTILTVPDGYTFYLTSYQVHYLNDSVSNFGRLVLRDGTTQRVPFLSGIRSGGSGATATAIANPTDFSEPIPFTTNVNAFILGGTITYSIFINGYLEAN